jgi:hypothetical protein
MASAIARHRSRALPPDGRSRSAAGRDSVGLEETEDGIWSIFFYDLLLGRWNERTLEVSA